MKKTLLLMSLALTQTLHAHDRAPIPDAQAVRAIVGEAAGESFEGKLAIACAIRNRGNLHGVYGLNATHVWR